MPKVRNITVAVTPELYRQTRHIAADANTNVTVLVRHILVNLPTLLRRTNHPGADWTGIAKPQSPPAAAAPSAPAPPPAVPAPQPAATAPQPAVSRSQSSASRAATLARQRAAALREAQRLLKR